MSTATVETKYKTLQLSSFQEGRIQQLTIERPEALNALNNQLLEDLSMVIHRLHEDPNLRVLIVTGSGDKAFVAGADIKEMENQSASQAQKMSERGQALFAKLEASPFTVIAAVNGFALGGGLELALACDFIVASENAKLGLPEVSLGLLPGYGGTQRLTRVLGKNWALRMILSGERISATAALQMGLVTEVVEPSQLSPRVMQLAEVIAAQAPLAQALAKKVIHQGSDLDLESGLKAEAKAFAQTFTTKDSLEGIQAFKDKRKPQFIGK